MKRLIALLLLAPAIALADLDYTLTPMPQAQSLRVTLTLDATEPEQSFRIPAWCPGFYFLLPYHEKVFDVRATAEGGAELRVSRDPAKEPRAWTVGNPSGGKMTLSYRVLGDDGGLGFFAANVRANTAFVNGPSTFMYPEGRKEEACRLRVNLPANWDIATAMNPNDAGGFSAGDYDELIDHPIQMGQMLRRPFTVENIPFEAILVSIDGRYPSNADQVVDELRQISRPAVQLFGGAPFKRYLYIIHLAVGDFNGGLEHRACNVIATENTSRLQLGTLASHEYFHAWNVKQIRPKILGPFDYTKENRTGNLWWAEGVTDYYAYITAYRSGRYQENWLLQSFTEQIRTLQSGKVRKSLTLEDCSKQCWEHGGFSVGDLDYYNKGLVAGLVFDAAIRSTAEGKKSLDDVMRLMWAKYRLPNPGFEEDGVLKALNEVAGKDLGGLYRRIVQSTEEVPFGGLQAIGLRVREPGKPCADVGFDLAGKSVTSVDTGPEEDGLAIGDKLLTVNGQPFSLACFAGMKPKDVYELSVQRGLETLNLKVRMGAIVPTNYVLERDPYASAEAKQRLAEFLKR